MREVVLKYSYLHLHHKVLNSHQTDFHLIGTDLIFLFKNEKLNENQCRKLFDIIYTKRFWEIARLYKSKKIQLNSFWLNKIKKLENKVGEINSYPFY